jgi:mRNA interferase RelE/StbE
VTKRLIRIHRLAKKNLDSFPAKHRKQIAQRLIGLISDPRPADSAKLKGEAELYRLDVGEYRVIYGFDQNTIGINIIDKRNDGAAYRKLARR